MTAKEQDVLLSFWGIGDMHYRAHPAWEKVQTPRFQLMYDDLQALWKEEGKPAFCVSPGDVVDTWLRENHELAKTRILEQMGDIPFYPGIGNHEYYDSAQGFATQHLETFEHVWEKSPRYCWQVGEVICIMLDYPDPTAGDDPMYAYVMPETLAFLDHTLHEYAEKPALIFLHCPLRNTVRDRDPERHRDYNSLQNFFSPENSQAVRNILALHDNVRLFISGHTHTGWEAPGIVCTERLGKRHVGFVNLMSPWYTGTHGATRFDGETLIYTPDEPHVIPSFQFQIYRDRAVIRVRDHFSKCWLKEWLVSF
ncbi:calcineurin-like phosphoesterase family protein [Thermosporothrix hazakensis]|uniref:Calcineurin-like phosphoesterase family protein n=2 Tax=Thermosporothrix TaxID=768650 RepID=A0A326UA67_THEHA|nr:metallophosphoesterase [Thermosporothrix hazakensis]PZW24231.1 calcineurin-like phosphoesterase family protein [Thermosporothrix hazakensis]BBH89677.1 hypothetical protein KTC_44280 [Thermosporothrix sp. COM3]GCE47863.1 hypothetical protein KTH_27320 [Thermosporothrix hazakensis]